MKKITYVQIITVFLIVFLTLLLIEPKMTKIVNEAKKNLVLTTAYSIIDSIKALRQEYIYLDKKVPGSIDLEGNLLNYKILKPTKGTAFIDEFGNIELTAYIDNYCLYKSFQSTNVEILDNNNARCGELYNISGNVTFSFESNNETPIIKILKNNIEIKVLAIDYRNIKNGQATYQLTRVPYGTYDIEFSFKNHTKYVYKDVLIDKNMDELNAILYKGDFNSDNLIDNKDINLLKKCLTENCSLEYDMNFDKKIDDKDVEILLNNLYHHSILDYNNLITLSGNINVGDASIKLFRNKEQVYETKSDQNGNYVFKNIKAGSYYIEVTSAKKQSFIEPVLFLTDEGGINFHLVPGYNNASINYTVLDLIEINFDKEVAELDLNSDNIINQSDYDIAKANLWKKSNMQRNQKIEQSQSKTVVITSNTKQAILTLNNPGIFSYELRLDDNGKITTNLPIANYVVNVTKDFYVLKDIVNFDVKNHVNLNLVLLFGDFNNDGQINNQDVEVLKNIVLEYKKNGNKKLIEKYDYNGDLNLDDLDIEDFNKFIASLND